MTTTVVNQNLVKVERRKSVEVPADVIDAEVVSTEPLLTPEEAASAFLTRNNEVVRLYNEGRQAFFGMGVHLREIRDQKLFVHGAFKNFEEYMTSLDNAYGISYQHANKLIQIVGHFSADEAKEIGVKKCLLIIEAAPEQRAGLKNQAKNGVSRRDIEAQVRAGHQGNSIQQVEPAGKVEEEPETAPTPPKQSEKRVTCVAREGLYGHALIDRKTELPATVESLKTEPCFTNITFENGATGLFIVQVDQKTGQLKAKICFQRKE